MRGRYFLLTVAIAGLWVPPTRAVSACTLGRVAELPVTMIAARPTIASKVNGADAQFIVDSGAFYSLITPAAANELHLQALHDDHAQALVTDVQGLGGDETASVTSVRLFMLGSIPLHNLQFFIAGSEVGNGAAGVLGQELLRIADVEYDLANGVIRLWRPRDCGRYNGAYWAGTQSYSVIDVNGTSAREPLTIGTARLNGTEIRVMFDSGAQMSMLTLPAARRAGFTPDGAGVVSGGEFSGLGDKVIPAWIAPFSSFEIGDEQIHNTHLRVADRADLFDVDMLLGADFFLSHRIYVANAQHKVFFTYNGGPVFNLAVQRLASSTQPTSTAAAQGAAAPPAPTATPAQIATAANQPTDAAGFARRGSAFASRGDFAHAIADLTRACDLAPNEPDYLYQRGMARWANSQPLLAMDDFDHALKLKPDDVSALVSRAELRLALRNPGGAATDLDAAARATPRQSDVRFMLGNLYTRIGRFEPAVAQYDLWIAAHPEGAHTPAAFKARCWARALSGQELKKALSDCNTALRLAPETPGVLDSRGLVEFRLGEFDRAIDDYDRALRSQPKSAWLLYARGVSELRAGRKTAGQADIAEAEALQPLISEVGRQRTVTP